MYIFESEKINFVIFLLKTWTSIYLRLFSLPAFPQGRDTNFYYIIFQCIGGSDPKPCKTTVGEGGKKIQEAEPRGLWMPPLARSCLKHFKKMHRSILTRYLMIKKFPSFCNQVTSSQEIFSDNFFVDRLVCLEVVENMTFKKVCSVDPDLLHFLVKKAIFAL